MIEEPDSAKALALAIDLVKKGGAEMLMRGSMDPKLFLGAVLDREKGLLKERVSSLVSVFDPPGVGRVTMATDTYINSFPSIAEKVTITENVIRLARVLGFGSPKIAALSAIEQVNPAIPSTLDAAILSKMAERGQFGDVTLEGPLDIDCAVSQRAAARKGVHSAVTGHGDIYLMPNVEAGLLMAEISVFIGKTPMACALMGVSHPVVLNLPFVPAENRLTELELAMLLCGRL
jgi:phosphate butyryltransferase